MSGKVHIRNTLHSVFLLVFFFVGPYKYYDLGPETGSGKELWTYGRLFIHPGWSSHTMPLCRAGLSLAVLIFHYLRFAAVVLLICTCHLCKNIRYDLPVLVTQQFFLSLSTSLRPLLLRLHEVWGPFLVCLFVLFCFVFNFQSFAE